MNQSAARSRLAAEQARAVDPDAQGRIGGWRSQRARRRPRPARGRASAAPVVRLEERLERAVAVARAAPEAGCRPPAWRTSSWGRCTRRATSLVDSSVLQAFQLAQRRQRRARVVLLEQHVEVGEVRVAAGAHHARRRRGPQVGGGIAQVDLHRDHRAAPGARPDLRQHARRRERSGSCPWPPRRAPSWPRGSSMLPSATAAAARASGCALGLPSSAVRPGQAGRLAGGGQRQRRAGWWSAQFWLSKASLTSGQTGTLSAASAAPASAARSGRRTAA